MWLERSELLLGKEGLEKLKNANILIVGVGGVGAYAAEMIARAGVGAAVSVFMLIVPLAIFILCQSNIIDTMSSSGMKD